MLIVVLGRCRRDWECCSEVCTGDEGASAEVLTAFLRLCITETKIVTLKMTGESLEESDYIVGSEHQFCLR